LLGDCHVEITGSQRGELEPDHWPSGYLPSAAIFLTGPKMMKLPHMPAAVVFDMDGLLFDTEALYQEASLVAAAEAGHDATSGIFSRTIGLPWPQTRSLLLDHFGDNFPTDEFITAWYGTSM
jgi:hypothetical protein